MLVIPSFIGGIKMYAVYVRQSVDRPDSISIQNQIDFCKYEVRDNHYKIYEDKGYSGKNTDRPKFKEMTKAIKDGVITKVVVYKLDRISRSILDFSNLIEMFQKYNVEFISSTEKFDTSTPMGRAMLNICIVFAQLERETIQKRVADAYISRSKKGFYMGGRIPYGFKKETCTIEGVKTCQYIPLEDETEQLVTAYEIYSSPKIGVAETIREMRERGIVKKRGHDWDCARLNESLRNPIYVKADADIYNYLISKNIEIINDVSDFQGTNGCYFYRKEFKDATKRKITDFSNLYAVIAPHEGIIDSDVWLKCVSKLDSNKQIKKGKSGVHSWLTGKIKCLRCNKALRFTRWVGKTTTNEYFSCADTTLKCSGFGTVKQAVLENVVLKQLKIKAKKVLCKSHEKDDSKLKQINSIKTEISKKEREIETLIAKIPEANDAVMKYINKQVDDIDNRISVLKNQLAIISSNAIEANIKEIVNYFEAWEKLTFDDKCKILDLMVDRILVNKENEAVDVQIIWKI